MRYYVYELRDPRDGSVFYVGKGQRNRIDQHEIEARSGRQSRKCDRIRAIEAAGLKVKKQKVARFTDEQDAFDAEAALILDYGLDNLTNVMPGGGTAHGAPTLYADRLQISATAEMVNRTRNGQVVAIYVGGQRLDLLPIIEHSKRAAAAVIKRRGFEWANAIAGRFNVRFANVAAL